MITFVAFVCTVLVAGLTLWAWFKGTGQELDATVDRVLTTDRVVVISDRMAAGYVPPSASMDPDATTPGSLEQIGGGWDEIFRDHRACREARRDGDWLAVCDDCQPVQL